MFFLLKCDRISQKNRDLAIANLLKAIAKQPKFRNLLKLHFDVRKVGHFEIYMPLKLEPQLQECLGIST